MFFKLKTLNYITCNEYPENIIEEYFFFKNGEKVTFSKNIVDKTKPLYFYCTTGISNELTKNILERNKENSLFSFTFDDWSDDAEKFNFMFILSNINNYNSLSMEHHVNNLYNFLVEKFVEKLKVCTDIETEDGISLVSHSTTNWCRNVVLDSSFNFFDMINVNTLEEFGWDTCDQKKTSYYNGLFSDETNIFKKCCSMHGVNKCVFFGDIQSKFYGNDWQILQTIISELIAASKGEETSTFFDKHFKFANTSGIDFDGIDDSECCDAYNSVYYLLYKNSSSREKDFLIHFMRMYICIDNFIALDKLITRNIFKFGKMKVNVPCKSFYKLCLPKNNSINLSFDVNLKSHDSVITAQVEVQYSIDSKVAGKVPGVYSEIVDSEEYGAINDVVFTDFIKPTANNEIKQF